MRTRSLFSRSLHQDADGSTALLHQSREPRRPFAACLAVLTLTGFIWILVFWRQFQIHQYWMFYLGPAAALGAAKSIVKTYRGLAARRPTAARDLTIVVALLMIALCVHEIRHTYAIISHPIEEVRAWQLISQRTMPKERVLLSWSPFADERHGRFVLRDIVPPQMAFYMDRAADVAIDVDSFRRLKNDHRIFVMHMSQATNDNPLFREATHLPPPVRALPLLFFDLGDAQTGDPPALPLRH